MSQESSQQESRDAPWRRLADAQRIMINTPRLVDVIHQRLADLALTLTGASSAAVVQDGRCVAHSESEGRCSELVGLAAAGPGEHPWRQGRATVVFHPEGNSSEPWSVTLVIGSADGHLVEGVAELAEGLLAVAEARLESTATVATLDAHRRQLEEAQRLARVGSWEWVAEGGVTTWSPMLHELLNIAPGTVPSNEALVAALHPDDRQAPHEGVERSRAGGVTTFDFRVPLADGSVRWMQGTAESELDAAGDFVRIWGTALDITERRRAEGELRAAETQFRLAMDYAPVGVALIGLDGRAIRMNPPLAALLGLDPSEVVGAAVGAFVHPEDMSCAFGAAIDLLNLACDSADCELRLQRADGSYVWTHSSASVLLNQDGKPQHIIMHVQDNTERRQRERDLERQANTDALTGLMNRRGWENSLRTYVEEALVGGAPLAVGLLDLDHFKVYNDTFGHPAGDQMLTEAATVWTTHLAKLAAGGRRCSLARIGGEEFGVVFPGASVDQAREVIVELCRLTPRDQSTSAGVTLWNPGEQMGDTLARADGALYSAKRQGRRRVVAVLPA